MTVKECSLIWSRGKTAMHFLKVGNVVVESNTFMPISNLYETIRQGMMEASGRDDGKLIRIKDVRRQVLKNNKIKTI